MARALLIGLDLEGVCASSGSACMVGSVQPSHVLLAMGVEPELASSTVRFSLGTQTTELDIEHCLRALSQVLARQAQSSRRLMKHTQLVVLNFGKSVLRHLRLLPDANRGDSYAESPLRDTFWRSYAATPARSRLPGTGGDRLLEPRLSTTAGLACWRTRTISLNPKLMEVSPAEVQRTLRHELAHFLAQHRAGRRRIAAHGAEWRKACRDLGIPNESRCHDLPLKRTASSENIFTPAASAAPTRTGAPNETARGLPQMLPKAQ